MQSFLQTPLVWELERRQGGDGACCTPEFALDPLDAITEAIALHAGWLQEAKQKGDTGGTVQRWTRRMRALQEAARELRALRQQVRPATWAPDELSDLPPGLIAQLSGPKTDALEAQILEVMRTVGGSVELNRLLIELYRRFGDVRERKALNNKAYRMVQKGLIHQGGGRGAYSLVAPVKAGGSDPSGAGTK